MDAVVDVPFLLLFKHRQLSSSAEGALAQWYTGQCVLCFKIIPVPASLACYSAIR